MFTKYLDFTENDFICDPDFQDWVINPNYDTDKQWAIFFAENLQKKEAAGIARDFLLTISFKEEFPEEAFVATAFQNHLDDINDYTEIKKIGSTKIVPLRMIARVAAVFIGVLTIVSAVVFFNKKNAVAVKTLFGNTTTILLPDSSFVTLNSNSTLKYSTNWGKGHLREVWLDGEAFFDVRHFNVDTNKISIDEHFVVHTNNLTVEVLGTTFDIRERRGKTEVALQTGKVKVSFDDNQKKVIVLTPGEMMTYDPNEKALSKKIGNAIDFSAWKEKKLILNDPTLQEIANYLEDNFGKKIILQGSQIGKRKIDGPILLNNLDDALFIISTVLNTDITKKENAIIISPR